MSVFAWSEEGGARETGTAAELVAFLRARDGTCVLYAGADSVSAQPYSVRAADYDAAFCSYRDSTSAYAFRDGALTDVSETHAALTGADGETAYLRIDSFHGSCAAEVQACLALMKERGRKHLILDLRGNGGGQLSVLTDLAGHFLRDGAEPIVLRMQERDGTQRVYSAATNDFSAYFEADSKIYVLADSGTASASECLIGALVDNETIEFENIYLANVRQGDTSVCRTYGKGVAQYAYHAPNGDVLVMTGAAVTWPSGRSIHGTGVSQAYGAKAIDTNGEYDYPDAFLTAALADLCA